MLRLSTVTCTTGSALLMLQLIKERSLVAADLSFEGASSNERTKKWKINGKCNGICIDVDSISNIVRNDGGWKNKLKNACL